jgi:hypothetical protein
MSERILATVTVEQMESGFYFALPDRPPVGPFSTEEEATEKALAFLEGAFTRLVEQFITGE